LDISRASLEWYLAPLAGLIELCTPATRRQLSGHRRGPHVLHHFHAQSRSSPRSLIVRSAGVEAGGAPFKHAFTALFGQADERSNDGKRQVPSEVSNSVELAERGDSRSDGLRLNGYRVAELAHRLSA
jgi:hypothetical protein